MGHGGDPRGRGLGFSAAFDLDRHLSLFADQNQSAAQGGGHLRLPELSVQAIRHISCRLFGVQIAVKRLFSRLLLHLETQFPFYQQGTQPGPGELLRIDRIAEQNPLQGFI